MYKDGTRITSQEPLADQQPLVQEQQIVMGMIASDKNTMLKNYDQIKDTYKKYNNNFGGILITICAKIF